MCVIVYEGILFIMFCFRFESVFTKRLIVLGCLGQFVCVWYFGRLILILYVVVCVWELCHCSVFLVCGVYVYVLFLLFILLLSVIFFLFLFSSLYRVDFFPCFLSKIFLDFYSTFVQFSSHNPIRNRVSMRQSSLISINSSWSISWYLVLQRVVLSSTISVCDFSFIRLRLALIFFCSSLSCGFIFSLNFLGMNISSFFMNSLLIFAVFLTFHSNEEDHFSLV